MKAAWIRNFWTKTVAFLLAAALVPVILTYVVGLIYSYGGMGRDFYTSDLCLNAVGKKTWEICDDYIAMEGGNYELDKIYSKGDSYSNIRFRVTDEQDKVEFSNVSDGDTFCYSTVYVDKTFDVYLVKGLPAQDDIYWAKVFYDKAENWGQNALEMLILFGAMELFLLIFLARTAARREDGELQGGWQEKIPFDLYLLVDGTIIALLCVAVEEVYSYVSFYTPPYDVLLLGISFALAVLVFAAWVTFCARVKVGGLWKGTIIYKLLCLCWKIVKWCWRVLCAFCRGVIGFLHAIPLVWRTAVGCLVVSMMLGIFAANRAGGAMLLTMLVLSVAACLFSLQLRKLQKEGEALAAGNLDAQVDTKWMYWDVKRHAENLNSIGDGMAAAMVDRMKDEFGTKPENIKAGIGPSIGICCFQVDKPVVDIFMERYKFADKYIVSDKLYEGKYKIDLWGINKEILLEKGVKADNIEIGGICTKCHPETFYSHRVMGEKRGTMGAFLFLK